MNIKQIFIKTIDICITGFSVVGILWSVVQLLIHYYPETELIKEYSGNIWVLIIPAIISILVKIMFVITKEFNIRYKIGDLKIIIKAGNILNKSDGIIVVGINEEMETNNKKIAQGSIHSQLIHKYGQEKLTKIFEDAKKDKKRNPKYFQKGINDKKYLFLIMSKLEGDGAASTKKDMIIDSLENLFFNQNEIIMLNNRMYFPVLGTGVAGMDARKDKMSKGGSRKQEGIKIIIENYLRFLKQSNEDNVSKIEEFIILINWKDIFKINWGELKRWTKNQKDHCLYCDKFYI